MMHVRIRRAAKEAGYRCRELTKGGELIGIFPANRVFPIADSWLIGLGWKERKETCVMGFFLTTRNEETLSAFVQRRMKELDDPMQRPLLRLLLALNRRLWQHPVSDSVLVRAL